MHTSQQTQQPVTVVIGNIQSTLRTLEMEAYNANLGYDFLIKVTRKQAIIGALVRNKWNQCKAARDLHIHRNTLSRQMAMLEIFPPETARNGYHSRKPVQISKVALRVNQVSA
jgi:Fis family transcriptional regulator